MNLPIDLPIDLGTLPADEKCRATYTLENGDCVGDPLTFPHAGRWRIFLDELPTGYLGLRAAPEPTKEPPDAD